MRRTVLLVFCGAWSLLGVSCNRPAQPASSFPNETAWSWQVEPQPAAKGNQWIAGGMVVLLHEWKGGGIRVTTVYLDTSAMGVYQFRAVVIDSSGRRHISSSGGGASSSGVSMKSFLFPVDSMTWEGVRFIGIEKLTEENMRTIVAPGAARKLKKAGADALGYPLVGKPYAFDLGTMDGTRISSGTLLGKVILLDFWASWCTPCMALLPELKTTYKKLKGRGFEVVGINLDNSIEKAREVTEKEKLPWPVVLAPTGEEQRELWQTAAGITTIPRLWLIDRTGILRADVWPSTLKAEIEKLIAD
jgi:thiol-disulfide isomerase/thioredoxin